MRVIEPRLWLEPGTVLLRVRASDGVELACVVKDEAELLPVYRGLLEAARE